MDKNKYKVVSKFECCGKVMVTVIIKHRAACIMPERDYNRIIENERKFRKKDKLRESA